MTMVNYENYCKNEKYDIIVLKEKTGNFLSYYGSKSFDFLYVFEEPFCNSQSHF